MKLRKRLKLSQIQIDLILKKYLTMASKWITRFKKEDEELVSIEQDEIDNMFRRMK